MTEQNTGNSTGSGAEARAAQEAGHAEATLWQRFKFWIKDTGKQLAIAIVIVLVLRSSIVEPYKIPSGSMIPTLFIGDHIFVNKLAYGLKVPFTEWLDEPVYVTEHELPERGDVIVFQYPKDESINYIKRVVGLPGDTIAIRNKTLLINDKPVDVKSLEDKKLMAGVENEYDRNTLSLYLARMDDMSHPVLYDSNTLLGSDWGPRTVPENHLFVMGDNRDRSSDSRAWGYVPLQNVKGKAMFVWLNFVINLNQGFDFGFRPSRIATWIN